MARPVDIERRNKIINIVLANGRATISELAKMFNVSTETIRKDVADLSEKKYSRRDMELFFLPVVILKIHFLIKYRKMRTRNQRSQITPLP